MCFLPPVLASTDRGVAMDTWMLRLRIVSRQDLLTCEYATCNALCHSCWPGLICSSHTFLNGLVEGNIYRKLYIYVFCSSPSIICVGFFTSIYQQRDGFPGSCWFSLPSQWLKQIFVPLRWPLQYRWLLEKNSHMVMIGLNESHPPIFSTPVKSGVIGDLPSGYD